MKLLLFVVLLLTSPALYTQPVHYKIIDGVPVTEVDSVPLFTFDSSGEGRQRF
jgi:hypothetical protein